MNLIHSTWKSYFLEDKSGDERKFHKYHFNIKEKEVVKEMYIQVDFYPDRMYPPSCATGTDKVLIQLYKDGSYVEGKYYEPPYGEAMLPLSNLGAGKYEIRVKVLRWKSKYGREYSLRTFSPDGVQFWTKDKWSVEQYVLGADSAKKPSMDVNHNDKVDIKADKG